MFYGRVQGAFMGAETLNAQPVLTAKQGFDTLPVRHFRLSELRKR